MKQAKRFFQSLIQKYKHLWILSYFFIYMTWFSYLEKTVTTHFHVIHVKLDDYIPFCEYFIVPYLLWFLYVACGVAYTAFVNKKDFYKLCGYLYTGMTIFLIISTIYPNGHFLRPYSFAHNNIFTSLCEKLYAIDTATNLFPSIHVYNSLGIHFAVRNSKELQKHKVIQGLSLVLCVSIILSTMFLKQHSVFDVTTAFILAFVMYQVVYSPKFARHTSTATNPVSGKHQLHQI